MRRLALLFFVALQVSFVPAAETDFIDPTGTYILKGTIQKNKITGHTGEIRVKLIAHDKIAISFLMSKGYPDYEFFSFTDTLAYDENAARYFPASHSDCGLVFCFKPHDAELQQVFTDPVSGCGFGNGVIISTYFKKHSADQPMIQDLAVHGQVR